MTQSFLGFHVRADRTFDTFDVFDATITAGHRARAVAETAEADFRTLPKLFSHGCLTILRTAHKSAGPAPRECGLISRHPRAITAPRAT